MAPEIRIYPIVFEDFEELTLVQFYDEELRKMLYTGCKYGWHIADGTGNVENIPRCRYANVFIHIDRCLRERRDLICRLDELLEKCGSPPVSRRMNEIMLHPCVCGIRAWEARTRGNDSEYARWIARASLSPTFQENRWLKKVSRHMCA